MTSNTFLKRYVIISLSIVIVVAAINYYIDIFGLFRGKKDRKVYINERTSKYLFSMRYIPENFDGFIIGPSLSANLNPEAIKDFKIYNASIMGANITELDLLIDNIIEKGHMKFAIVCLSPYLTKDHGKKAATINPIEYYGAFGSTNLLKTYLLYFVRQHNLAPNRYAANIHNVFGWDNFELEMHDLSAKDTILAKAARNDFDHAIIDTVAYRELGQTLEKLRKHNIQIIGYYTPVPYQLYSLGKDEYHDFEKQVNKFFTSKDVLIDLNDEKYKAVNEDFSMFIDHGHLSAKGQAFVLHTLDSTLHQLYKK